VTALWVRRPATRPHALLRLFCFHYAGGGASLFRRWPQWFSSEVELVALQLPGREDRFAEPPYDRMGPLVERLATVLAPHLDRPYAFFGHSMGARVCLALAQLLHRRGRPVPRMLLVAASPAPILDIPVRGWNESEEGLTRYVRSLGGTPPEVLDAPDLLALLLPTVRADLTAVATWPYQTSARLPCAVRAFAGKDDAYASPFRMRAWQAETDGSFALQVLPGGHFFIHSGAPQLVDAVRSELMSCWRDPAAERGRTS
jgi:surfactin synthase thioesterase subunit